MTAWLYLLGWLGCVIYGSIPCFWLLVHPRVDYWRSRRRSPYRVLLPAWMGIWAVLGLITWHWRKITLYSVGWSWLPAIVLFAVGLWIYTHSSKQFSAAQLGGLPELVPGHREQRLVTSGLRARVRHPVYLAHLCEMLAWSLGTGLAACYGLTAFAILTGGVMIRMEDKELERRFGEEFRAYKRQVPAVIPRAILPRAIVPG